MSTRFGPDCLVRSTPPASVSQGYLVNADKSERGELKTFQVGYTAHIEHTKNLSVIDTHSIAERHFTVVVDAVNGAASFALPAMVEALGCKVHRLHCEPNGKFPRGAEPLPQNLKKLGEAVLTHRAHVGFATDPDGDRLAVVDENGQPLGEEYTLTICADGFLSSNEKLMNSDKTAKSSQV